MKKHLILKAAAILLVLLTLLALAACNNTAAGDGDDTAEPVQQRDPAVYVIVRSDNGSQEETDGAVRLRKYIRETMGIEIDLETDWVKRGSEVDSSCSLSDSAFLVCNCDYFSHLPPAIVPRGTLITVFHWFMITQKVSKGNETGVCILYKQCDMINYTAGKDKNLPVKNVPRGTLRRSLL